MHQYSYRNKPDKSVLVCRFGAFGDLLQASSVLAGLKQQGYHVTLMCSPPGDSVVKHDPNIDAFMVLDKDQVPNLNLADFWKFQAKRFTKFVNLSESVEGTFLALPGRTQHTWSHEVRRKLLDHNYLEFQHMLAEVPHKPQVRFYATLEEKAWARTQRERMGRRVVLWSLAGSSVHKTNAGLDPVIARTLVEHPDTEFVLVGGPETKMLEAGWENEKRVHCRAGVWSIRQTLAFVDMADCIVGPETGVLNAGACLPIPKVVFMSHSSVNQLTRDWINTTSLVANQKDVPCSPCMTLHYGWQHCWKDEESGTAMCQKFITPDMIYAAIEESIYRREAA